jgi:hypothetical protein
MFVKPDVDFECFIFGMFVLCDFVLRSVLPLWFAAGYFRNGGCGRVVIAICPLKDKYLYYSHVTCLSPEKREVFLLKLGPV